MSLDIFGNVYNDGTISIDSTYGSPIDTSQVYIPSGYGTPDNVPTTDPATAMDPWAILSKVGSIAKSGVDAANSFLTARDSLQFARQDRQLAQQRTQLQYDLARQQLTAQSTTDQARIAATTAATNAALSRMPGLTTLFGGNTAPRNSDWLMLALTALGVYYSWRAIKGH